MAIDNQEIPLGQSPDLLGGSSSVTNDAVNVAQTQSVTNLIGRASYNTVESIGVNIAQALTPTDPDFKLDDNWDALTTGIPDEFHDNFEGITSLQEGLMERNHILGMLEDRQMLAHSGFTGAVAMFLGSVTDLPSLLTAGSGGSVAGPRFAAAMNSSTALVGTRVAKVAETAVIGGEYGAASGIVEVAADPLGDWTTIPDYVIGGMTFGAAVGTVLPKMSQELAQEKMNMLREEFNLRKEQGLPIHPNDKPIFQERPDAVNVEVVSEKDVPDSVKANFATDSVGSASRRTEPVDPVFRNQDTASLLKEVREKNIAEGWTGDTWDIDTYFNSNLVSKASKRLYKAVNKTLWASDYGYGFNSGSVIAQHLVARLLESPEGIVLNNRTAAILMPQYQTEIMLPVAKTYKSRYNQWLAEAKSQQTTALAWNDINIRQRFDREVMLELQTRYHDNTSHPNSSKSVKEMADAIDEASARAVDILKGRNGERSVNGAEELEATPGWYRQVWSGQSILKVVERAQTKFGAKDGRKLIKKAISSSYQKLHRWDKEIADRVAGAVVNNAIAREGGVNTNLFRLVSNDNGEYLREVLKNDGVSDKFIDDLLDRIKIDTANRGKIKSLKSRNDIDLRTPIAGTDMTLLDLVEADINKTWSQYARSASGAASVARNGIQLHEIRSRWIPAIKDELQSRGAKPLSEGYYEALETYFSGGAYSNGVNPWLRRMLSTTNLALLNGLGVTQTGEVGAGIAAMGLDNFIHAAPEITKGVFNGKLSPIHEDLQYIDSSIIGDHNIYRPELLQNETRAGVVNSELERNIDQLLAKGARVQGFISGYYKVNQWMQQMSGNTLINRVGQIANGKYNMGDLRKQSLGFNPKNEKKIMEYFRNGTVEYRDGRVHDLHADKWDYSSWQEFAAIINRNSAQSVQKGLRGEDAWWMHKDTGAFLMHLKSFTFTAMHKQLIRNGRMADPEALATLFFSMITAASAYTARQYLSGQQEKLDGEKLIKGMLNYNNLTAPIVTFTDPAFGMLGMNDFQVGNFGNAHGGNNSLIAMPSSFNVANRISQIPGAAVRGLTGDLTKNDVYALQATPIFGNLYGMGYIANALKDDIDKRKREEKRQQAAVKQPVKAESKPDITDPAPVKDSKDVINEVIKMGEEQ